MLSNIGISLVVLVLILSFLIIYTASLDLKTPRQIIQKNIYKLSLFQTTFTILSFFTLIIGFINSDFSLINVYENSHTAKPFFYNQIFNKKYTLFFITNRNNTKRRHSIWQTYEGWRYG